MIIVKGTSYYQSSIKSALSSGVLVGVLVPEPDNPYDPMAMQVQVDGRKVGYLPRGWIRRHYAGWVIHMVKDGEGLVDIAFVGGFQLGDNPDDCAYLGVRIFVEPLEPDLGGVDISDTQYGNSLNR